MTIIVDEMIMIIIIMIKIKKLSKILSFALPRPVRHLFAMKITSSPSKSTPLCSNKNASAHIVALSHSMAIYVI